MKNKENKNYFMKTGIFGKLAIFDVLLEYDYPRIFVCSDEFNSKYLFYEYSSEELVDKWLVQRITDNRLKDIKNNKISLQECYFNPEGKGLFDVEKNYATNKFSIEMLDNIPENTLLEGETFVGTTYTFDDLKDKWIGELLSTATPDIFDSSSVPYLFIDVFNDVEYYGFMPEFSNYIKELNNSYFIRALLIFYNIERYKPKAEFVKKDIFNYINYNDNYIRSDAFNTLMNLFDLSDIPLESLKTIKKLNRWDQEHLNSFIKEKECEK